MHRHGVEGVSAVFPWRCVSCQENACAVCSPRESGIACAEARDRTAQSMPVGAAPIPGIGYVTALTAITEVVDADRFGSPEKLVLYVGITPS